MADNDLDDDLRLLRSLDPADPPRPQAGSETEAQALLRRIRETPRHGAGDGHALADRGSGSPSAGDHTGPSSPRGRGWRRWAVAATAAAAVTAGLIAVNSVGTPQPAFATWTAVPQPVPQASLEDVSAQCSSDYARERFGQEVFIAEERGRVTFIATVSQSNMRHCLVVDGEWRLSGGGTTQHGMEELDADGGRAILGSGSIARDGDLAAENTSYSVLLGEVGDDVVGVDIHPAADPEHNRFNHSPLPESVTATVSNNHFGAWWPGATSDWHLTLHLTDGSTVERLPAFEHD
ncbi:MAG TPA: hypothetical protein VK024_08970, partial [Actinomycetaceae bacterium]|nr:hypothetical protein [Actinomycetaceae bacterium]